VQLFPGYSNYFNSRISRETQEDFNILKDFVQEMKFDRMGCFKKIHIYLLEDDVPDTVKQDRANELWNYNHRYLGILNQEK
jgi:ribosomal protein S12 methylthiotransferase